MSAFKRKLRDLDDLEAAARSFILSAVTRRVAADTRRRHVHQYSVSAFRQYVLLPIARRLDVERNLVDAFASSLSSNRDVGVFFRNCGGNGDDGGAISFVRNLLVHKAPRDLRFGDADRSIADTHELICTYVSSLARRSNGTSLNARIRTLVRDEETFRCLTSSSSSSSSLSSSSSSSEDDEALVRRLVKPVRPSFCPKSILKKTCSTATENNGTIERSTRGRRRGGSHNSAIDATTVWKNGGRGANYIAINVNCCCGRAASSIDGRQRRSASGSASIVDTDNVAVDDAFDPATLSLDDVPLANRDRRRRRRRADGDRPRQRRGPQRTAALGRIVTAIEDVSDRRGNNDGDVGAHGDNGEGIVHLPIEYIPGVSDATAENVAERDEEVVEVVADESGRGSIAAVDASSDRSAGPRRRMRRDVSWLLRRTAKRKTVPGYDPADHPEVGNRGAVDRASIRFLRDPDYVALVERTIERTAPLPRNVALFDASAREKWRNYDANDPTEAQLARMRLSRNEHDFLLRSPYVDPYTAGLFVRSPEELALSREYFARSRLVPDAKLVFDPRNAESDEERLFDSLVQRKIRQTVRVINAVPPVVD